MLVAIMHDRKVKRQFAFELRHLSSKLGHGEAKGRCRIKPGFRIAIGIYRGRPAGGYRKEAVGEGGHVVAAPMQGSAHQEAASDRLASTIPLALHGGYDEGKARGINSLSQALASEFQQLRQLAFGHFLFVTAAPFRFRLLGIARRCGKATIFSLQGLLPHPVLLELMLERIDLRLTNLSAGAIGDP